jgi:hypothetical protein
MSHPIVSRTTPRWVLLMMCFATVCTAGGCGSDTTTGALPVGSVATSLVPPATSQAPTSVAAPTTLPATTSLAAASLATASPATTQPAATLPETTAAATADPTKLDAFRKMLRTEEAAVMDLYEKLGQPATREESVDQLRKGVCSPAYTVPDRNKVEVQLAMVIRGKAQADPAVGAKWLKDGILTQYSREDQAGGTFIVNVVWSDEVLKRLADAQMSFAQKAVAGHDNFC